MCNVVRHIMSTSDNLFILLDSFIRTGVSVVIDWYLVCLVYVSYTYIIPLCYPTHDFKNCSLNRCHFLSRSHDVSYVCATACGRLS